MQVYHAAVAIPAGGMLTTSYAPCAALARHARHAAVGMDERGFVCACARCAAVGTPDSPAARAVEALAAAAGAAAARVCAMAGLAACGGSLVADAEALGGAGARDAAVRASCLAAWRAQAAAVGLSARSGGLRAGAGGGGDADVLRAEGLAPALVFAMAAAVAAAAAVPRSDEAFLADAARVATEACWVLDRVAPAGPEHLMLARDMAVAAAAAAAAGDGANAAAADDDSGVHSAIAAAADAGMHSPVAAAVAWRAALLGVVRRRFGAGPDAGRVAAHLEADREALL